MVCYVLYFILLYDIYSMLYMLIIYVRFVTSIHMHILKLLKKYLHPLIPLMGVLMCLHTHALVIDASTWAIQEPVAEPASGIGDGGRWHIYIYKYIGNHSRVTNFGSGGLVNTGGLQTPGANALRAYTLGPLILDLEDHILEAYTLEPPILDLGDHSPVLKRYKGPFNVNVV